VIYLKKYRIDVEKALKVFSSCGDVDMLTQCAGIDLSPILFYKSRAYTLMSVFFFLKLFNCLLLTVSVSS